MKRSQLKRKSPLRGANTLRTHRPMRRVSKKRSKENKLYSIVRKEHLTDFPRCQVCGVHPSTEIHHRRGRWKSRLTDKTYFLAVCRACHDRIHHNPQWAYANGLLLLR